MTRYNCSTPPAFNGNHASSGKTRTTCFDYNPRSFLDQGIGQSYTLLMSQSITIYGKDNCPHTRRALDAHPEANFVDVIHHPDKLDEMLALNGGQRRVPTIVENGQVTVGFNRGS